MIPKPAPQKLGVIQTTTALIADYRMNTIWYAIMERSFQEAVDKLKETVKTTFNEDPIHVAELVPCIVDIKEARTKREEQSIRRVHKRLSFMFAGLIDRLVRYEPASRPYAWDWLKQELINWRPLYREYTCENFRPKPIAEETDAKKKGKKKK